MIPAGVVNEMGRRMATAGKGKTCFLRICQARARLQGQRQIRNRRASLVMLNRWMMALSKNLKMHLLALSKSFL